MKNFKRPIFIPLLKRIQQPRLMIQVLGGPRQVGKTTLAWQLLESINFPGHYVSADGADPLSDRWIEQQWQTIRLKMAQTDAEKGLLVIDEIQKIPQWSAEVKRLWDEDSQTGLPLHVILLGSSQLLLHHGLNESLTGRFEVTPITHWSFPEMAEAFHCSLDEYIYFGGYPGAYALHDDEARWRSYIRDAFIETTVSRDILQMSRVEKPALLRRLFDLGAHCSGQILSYQKMMGQLQDAGNTTTLSHYLQLLNQAGLLAGLDKFAGQAVRQRASSPKFQVWNNALYSAQTYQTFQAVRNDPERWGRQTESAVGAHLLNSAKGMGVQVMYWRDRQWEVDFVLQRGEQVVAIEVKSSCRKTALPGVQRFYEAFSPHKTWLVGGQGVSFLDFFNTSVDALF